MANTAIVTVGSVTFSGISAFSATHEKIVNFERDAKGNAHGDLIARKWKLQITFGTLTAAQTAAILNAVSPFSFTVSFYNPETQSSGSFIGYEGNKNFPLWKRDPAGGFYTQGGTLNLIEM